MKIYVVIAYSEHSWYLVGCHTDKNKAIELADYESRFRQTKKKTVSDLQDYLLRTYGTYKCRVYEVTTDWESVEDYKNDCRVVARANGDKGVFNFDEFQKIINDSNKKEGRMDSESE